MKRITSFLAIVLLMLPLTPPSGADEVNYIITENAIEAVDSSALDGKTLVVSPDGTRVAFKAKAGDKWCFVIDWEKGKPYDEVRDLCFSPDSKRVAYVGKVKNKFCVIIDGQEKKGYDEICNLHFSPDSRQVIYEGKVKENFCGITEGNKKVQYVDLILSVLLLAVWVTYIVVLCKEL